MKEYYKKVDNETINKLMASLEENEKAIRDMNEKRGLTIYTNHEICDVYNTPRFSDRHNYGGMTRNRYICKKEENQNGKTI